MRRIISIKWSFQLSLASDTPIFITPSSPTASSPSTIGEKDVISLPLLHCDLGWLVKPD